MGVLSMAKTTKKTEQAKPDNKAQANLLATKKPRGKPRAFPTESDFQDAFYRYIKHCFQKQLLPNISGFSVFCDISPDTFYAQQEYYPDTYKKVRAALEDCLIQHERFGQKNPAMAIVQGKNTFRWDDTGKGKVDSSILDVDIDIDEETLDLMMSKLGYLPDPDL